MTMDDRPAVEERNDSAQVVSQPAGARERLDMLEAYDEVDEHETDGLGEDHPPATLSTAMADAVAGVTGSAGTFGHISRTSSTQDELELVAEAQKEAVQRARRRRGRRPTVIKPLAVLKEVDRKVAAIGEGEDGFLRCMADKIREYNIVMPTITVEYRNLCMATDALIGSSALPSVGNEFVGLLKRLLFIKPNVKRFKILDNLNGVLSPARPTLLLGPPGCGKTAFLKVLSGQYKNGSQLEVTGDLKYNGHTQSDFVIERTAGYIGQYDVHIPSLSVMETLEYAFVCQNGLHGDGFNVAAELLKAHNAQRSSEDEQPKSPVTSAHGNMSDREFFELMMQTVGTGFRTVGIMRMMGISHTADTPVGDAMLRGISGGERKRVTTAEMLVGPKRMLLADEISTGLDSATLHAIMQVMTRVTRGLKLTQIISLLQPPPEVFNLFDDLILMADGQIVYNGPISEVVPFFNSLGFIIPTRKDVPSFLQEVTTPMGQVEYSSPELRRAKGIPADLDVYKAGGQAFDFLVPVPEMVEAYWRSPPGLAMKAKLDKPVDPASSHPAALVQTRYALSFWEAMWVVLKRQIKLILRDPVLVKGRLGQCTVIGLIIGSLFYQLPVNSTDSRKFFGALFLHSMFMAMGQMPALAVTVATKSVWYKQRSALFYSGLVHSIATLLSAVPASLLDSGVYSIIVYWMNGFCPTAGAFFTFWLIMFLFSLSGGALFRLVAFIAPNGVSANAYGGLVLLVLIVLSGFTILRPAIPDWWIWGYYISPFAWSLRSLVINEMTCPRWDVLMPGSTTLTMGVYSLESFGFYTDRAWLWGGVAYLFGFVLLCIVCGGLALQYLDGEAPVARVVDQDELQKARDKRTARHAVPDVVVVAPGEDAADAKAAGSHVSIHRSSPPTRAPVTAAQVLGPATSAGSSLDVSSSLPFTPVTLVFQNLRYFVPNPSYKGKAAHTTAPPPAEPGSPVRRNSPSNGSRSNKVAGMEVDGKPPAGKAAKDVEAAADQDLEVPPQLELLKGLSGYAEPRVLIALMGGSGAGKTTLMDCIAGRKTVGHITGHINVNGHPKQQATWARVMGYVEQTDIHTPALTVVESLRFSARLRLPASIPDNQAYGYVDDVLSIVDMSDNMFDYVGVPGVSGLSVEQRKRLTIGVELVANPSVIFMDEPTSGLDARAAAIVMRAVRNVARNNRTVMVTIHQPSIEIFEAFDMLLLLQRGGRMGYFGPLGRESCQLISYLEAVPGCGSIPPGANPATWMLEVTGGALAVVAKAVKADWPALYANSPLAAQNDAHGKDLIARLSKTEPPLSYASPYAATYTKQYWMLLYKFRLAYWRTPSYNWTRMVTTVITALFYGSTYFQAGALPAAATVSNVQSVMGIIFSSTTFLGMSGLMAVMPFLGLERVVYYREQAGRMYSPWAYGVISTLVEVPYLLVQTALFLVIVYPMMKYIQDVQHFFFYYLFVFLSLLFFNTFGSSLVYVTPSQQIAQVAAAGLTFLWNIMNGFVITFPTMPKYWQWLNRCSPTTWILYALGSDQLGDSQVPFSYTAGAPSTGTVGEFMTTYFGYLYSFRFYCIPILLAYIVFFRVMAVLALRYISFLRR